MPETIQKPEILLKILLTQDNVVIIQYGRINRNGKELIKRFGSEDEAAQLYEKQINSKLKKYKIAVQQYKQLRFNF